MKTEIKMIQRMEKTGAVAMRLFATWEMDRASTSAVQRVLTLNVSRLTLAGASSPLTPVVFTVKLEGAKRLLRTNEIPLIATSDKVDTPLDISFTIHYPHDLKRKRNILQLMIQQKRKHRNRPFVLPYKTLHVGMIDLTQLVQHGTVREIVLWRAEDLERQEGMVTSIGTIAFSYCQSNSLEAEDRDRPARKEGFLSEDFSDSDFDDVGLDELAEGSSEQTPRTAFESVKDSKMIAKKNIKQKISKLIKKFKDTEEVISNSRGGTIALTPTAQELKALYAELDELSDSGSEMVPDDVSVRSNPRPALRPYFALSKEVLPAIFDPGREIATDSDAEADAEENWSSEENGKDISKYSEMTRMQEAVKILPLNPTVMTPRPTQRVSLTNSAPLGGTGFTAQLPHSQTTGSINKKENRQDVTNNQKEKWEFIGNAPHPSWICSDDDRPYVFQTSSDILPATQCDNFTSVKQQISEILKNIEHFCSSNSSNPPINIIALTGGDKLIGQVLRTFVDLHKTSGNFLGFIRFLIFPHENSLLKRLISGVDTYLDTVISESCNDTMVSPDSQEREDVANNVLKWAEGATTPCNLPIGEVLLQLATSDGDAQTIFVPFLAEVRVSFTYDEPYGSDVYSPRFEEGIGLGGSPPCSPHARPDSREINLEYWVEKESATPPSSSASIHGSGKKDSSKSTIKSSFRSIVISRAFMQSTLMLEFVKEKKKEKMLQKLGMKKGQKSEIDFTPQEVRNVPRVLCSGTGKHCELNVFIDGALYTNVRFFQTSALWQTHVKSFPIAISRINGSSL